MSGGTAGAPISASVGSATNSQIAVGTDIRQQAIYLTVALSSGDPAALDRVAHQVKFQPLPGPVDATGVDFPNLLGRGAQVEAARLALAEPRSVAVFGPDGVGKSVLLRHLAPRVRGAFTRGVALVATGGNQWQDVAQEVVQSFYEAEIAPYLGPAQLRRLLGPLDALVLLDEVSGTAGIEQLFAMLKAGSVVVASTQRLLPGDSRAIRLEGLDDAASVALIQATLDDLGLTVAVDPSAATRVGRALAGHPGQIIERVIDADGRHVTLAQLADELEAGAAPPNTTLTPDQQAVVKTVAALDGAPAGSDHIAAVAGVPERVVDELAARQSLRAASPQLRLGVDLAAAAGDLPGDLDEVRERFLAHFVRWATAHRDDPVAVGAESRAIEALLRWANDTGRYPEVVALAEAADTGLAASGRWGTWSEATQYRLQAAESLHDGRQAAIAINQMGVQALGDDEAELARDLFTKARDRADVLGEALVSSVAESNRRLIDGLLGPPTDDEPDEDDDGNGTQIEPPPRNPWPVVVAGAVIVVAVISALFLMNRKAIAIEPANRVFDSASVDADGERATFRVTNQGAVRLDTLDVRLVGDSVDAFFIVGGDCPGATLAAGASCTVDVLFHPVRPGQVQASLSVTAGDGTVVVASIGSVAVPVTPEPTPSPSPTPSPTPSTLETAPPAQLADIVIEAFAPTGEPRKGEGLIAVPVEVAVKNVGKGAADQFPIVITADGVAVEFQVSGTPPARRLMTRAPLRPDETFTYDGTILLPDETALDSVLLIVAADSCTAKGATPGDCPVKDDRPQNNTYPLQSADIVVSGLTIGPQRKSPIGAIFLTQYVYVDVSFDVANTGHEATGDFWIASFQGQNRPTLGLDQVEIDRDRGMPRVPSLKPRDRLHLSGTVAVPRPDIRLSMAIEAGCPVGSEPCAIPEIAFDNNRVTGSIPLPPEPTPTPTPAPTPTGAPAAQPP